jgi:peptidoglycan/xylan/chitin deacetylase (PgdA/CDA1 family)
MKKILLTFDVEEFDFPGEFEKPLDIEQEFETSKQGLLLLRNLLAKYNIRATFFTTANFAKKYPRLIKELSKEHEIACHGYNHSDNYCEENSFLNIAKAKAELERIIGKKIIGFRAPRFQINEISKLFDLGFVYDSSVHPTWIPGRYMNLSEKRNIHKKGKILEIPLSTLPLLRLPIAWMFFRNFGLNYAKAFTKINFTFSNYTMLLFHSWEFTNLHNFKIPKYLQRNTGQTLLKMLEKYIRFSMRNKYKFEPIKRYLENKQI